MAFDFIKRLFGGGDDAGGRPPAAEAGEDYNGFTIIADPLRQGGQFVTAGRIVKEDATGRKEHRFVRADTHASLDEAKSFTVQKARRLIDEQGDGLFG